MNSFGCIKKIKNTALNLNIIQLILKIKVSLNLSSELVLAFYVMGIEPNHSTIYKYCFSKYVWKIKHQLQRNPEWITFDCFKYKYSLHLESHQSQDKKITFPQDMHIFALLNKEIGKCFDILCLKQFYLGSMFIRIIDLKKIWLRRVFNF